MSANFVKNYEARIFLDSTGFTLIYLFIIALFIALPHHIYIVSSLAL